MKSDTAPEVLPPGWRVHPDPAAVARDAAGYILALAQSSIAARGRFQIVLAGGRTPLAVYGILAGAHADWSQWHWYLGDERCLPAGDAGRNDSAIRAVWLDRIPAPSANIHTIPAELGAEAAAKAYANTLSAVGEFDLVLLGLGEDGHTASLFPGRPLDDRVAVIAVHDAPKPPPDRVSLSAARLSRTRHVLVLVTGEEKRDAVRAWRQGADVPVRNIRGPVQAMFDVAAIGP